MTEGRCADACRPFPFRVHFQAMEDLTLLWIPAGLLFILAAVMLMFLLT